MAIADIHKVSVTGSPGRTVGNSKVIRQDDNCPAGASGRAVRTAILITRESAKPSGFQLHRGDETSGPPLAIALSRAVLDAGDRQSVTNELSRGKKWLIRKLTLLSKDLAGRNA